MEPAVGLGACRRGAADAFTRANARIARPDSTATLTATSDPKPTVGRARNMIGHARRILLRGQPGGRLVSRRAALTAAISSMWLLTSQPAEAASVDLTARRDDGSLIYWSLDRQHGGPKQGILVLAQGSGCLAATENANLVRAKRLLPDFAVVTVEKYGVRPHEAPKDPVGGCSPEFYAQHTSASAWPTTNASWPRWRRPHGGTGLSFCSAVRRVGPPSRCWRHASGRQRSSSSPRRLAGPSAKASSSPFLRRSPPRLTPSSPRSRPIP